MRAHWTRCFEGLDVPPGDRKDPIPTEEPGGLVFPLTIAAPPSRAGQHLWFFLDPDDVDALLRECRDAAIYRRRQVKS